MTEPTSLEALEDDLHRTLADHALYSGARGADNAMRAQIQSALLIAGRVVQLDEALRRVEDAERSTSHAVAKFEQSALGNTKSADRLAVVNTCLGVVGLILAAVQVWAALR